MKRLRVDTLRATVQDHLGSHRTAARIVTALAAAGLVALMAGMAATWSNATTVERVSVHARELNAANSAAGAAGITRAAVSQALVFEADRQLGIVDDDDAAIALSEAEAALGTFQSVVVEPSNETAAFTLGVQAVIAQLRDGDVAGAVETRNQALEPAFRSLVDVLDDQQRTAETAIRDTQTSAGRTARFTQLFIILAIPSGSMLAYWLVVRRRLHEQELDMKTKLDAERAVNDAKDELIAGISHELRTPLTGIHGFSEILMTQGLEDRDMAMDLISIIHTESGELSRMIDDLLTAARIDAGELGVAIEPTDLAAAIETVLQPVIRSGREIAVSCPPLWVAADPLRLRQVLRNLVSNAAKHGGPNIAVIVDQADGRARITVADDGAGVSEGIITRLFDRFVNGGRGALLAGSIGLGLAVARGLVERMGGTIGYQRIDDITMFDIEVPLAEVTVPVGPASRR